MLAIPFNSKFSLSYMILLKKIVTTNQKGFFPMRTPAFNNCQRSRQKPPINIFSSFFKLLIQLLSMRQIFFLVATHFYYSFCTTIFKQLCNNIFILFWKKMMFLSHMNFQGYPRPCWQLCILWTRDKRTDHRRKYFCMRRLMFFTRCSVFSKSVVNIFFFTKRPSLFWDSNDIRRGGLWCPLCK